MIQLIGPKLTPRVVVLLVVTTAALLITLVWVGWRVLDLDQALEDQQVRQRIERGADIVTAALQRAVAATERRLADGGSDWAEGAVVMIMEGDRADVRLRDRVAYVPVAPRLPEPPTAPFAVGETVEFREQSAARAAAIYRKLAVSTEPAVRAGALLRLARCLRASGNLQEALDIYSRLFDVDGLAFGEVPISLVARNARCSLLATLDRRDELRREAEGLAADLWRGRWVLERPVARLHAGDVLDWGASPPPRQEQREQLAEGLVALRETLAGPGSAAAGRMLLLPGAEPLVAIWTRSGSRATALVATLEFVSSEWLAVIEPVLLEQRVKLTMHTVAGALPPGAVRRAEETGLPWTLIIDGRNPGAERDEYSLRRRLITASFVILVLLAAAAAYLTIRAISLELAAARLQSDFVAAVSHEFRTPLTSLRQFTDMLREHANLGDDRKRTCYDAQARATTRLTRLVESLLDFGRMEGGARLYQFEPQDAAGLVRRVVDEYRAESQATRFNIRLSGDCSSEIQADAEALGRALWNLLDNAVKYSGESREIEVELQRRGDEIAISVQDHGLGIPKGEQAAIFQKFQRGAEAQRLGIKGTGIGLTMVDHIVKAHRGRIELQSEPGRGSTFTVILPAASAAVALHDQSRDQTGAAL